MPRDEVLAKLQEEWGELSQFGVESMRLPRFLLERKG